MYTSTCTEAQVSNEQRLNCLLLQLIGATDVTHLQRLALRPRSQAPHQVLLPCLMLTHQRHLKQSRTAMPGNRITCSACTRTKRASDQTRRQQPGAKACCNWHQLSRARRCMCDADARQAAIAVKQELCAHTDAAHSAVGVIRAAASCLCSIASCREPQTTSCSTQLRPEYSMAPYLRSGCLLPQSHLAASSCCTCSAPGLAAASYPLHNTTAAAAAVEAAEAISH